MTYTVTNKGTAEASGTIYLRVISNGTPKSGYMTVSAFPAGQSSTKTFAVGHDSSWPVGSYAIKMEVDYQKTIEKSNESNNVSNELSFTVR